MRNLVRAKRRERDCRNTAEIFGGGGRQEGIAKNEESRSGPREWTARGKKTKTEDQKNNADGKD